MTSGALMPNSLLRRYFRRFVPQQARLCVCIQNFFHHENTKAGKHEIVGVLFRAFVINIAVCFLFVHRWSYRWISANDVLQMPAIYGLAANIVKKVLKNNDLC